METINWTREHNGKRIKRTAFSVKYEDGQTYTWHFWRNPGVGWILESHDGEIRILYKNWIDSVALINTVLDNYGMLTRLS